VANIDQIGYRDVRSECPIGVDNSVIELVTGLWNKLIGRVRLRIRQWTRAVTTGLVTGILSDSTRSRADLITENALLRQQLIVLRRQVKRPQLTQFDRIRLVLLARFTRFWQFDLVSIGQNGGQGRLPPDAPAQRYIDRQECRSPLPAGSRIGGHSLF
jgi:hypothetical protein